MQYVRNLSDSVSTAWNSLNPATLSGAIDVIVVEHDDGTLACSPFHVRFGKFSLLRPSEKKVEFRVNGSKQEYSMKLGEGGEAFFVFETSEAIPQSLQTSPVVSPASSPPLSPDTTTPGLQEPDQFDLDEERPRRPTSTVIQPQTNENGILTPVSSSPKSGGRPASGDWTGALIRPHSDNAIRHSAQAADRSHDDYGPGVEEEDVNVSERSQSPPPLAPQEALRRAMALSKELDSANIPTKVTESGDLMLDMTGFKSSEEDMIRAEILARRVLSEELDGNYDIGSLFGFDAEGNLWIYSSEEARRAAMESTLQEHDRQAAVAADAVSDPGYQSDGSDVTTSPVRIGHRRSESDAGPMDMQTPPRTPTGTNLDRAPRNYAKTLRLTSDQLRALDLKAGPNAMSFTVNRATCSANMYLWRHETPVVISDIDGTVTKSDALGHFYNMIGRDWTHTGIAKLYCDIVANGYNIMYLTSRSVGQADTTRAYLNNITQEGYRMPAGPTILSPDRTMAALRREIYLRQPQVFKMATLRDIRNLYGPDHSCFYAGFGNRLTDQMSYRTVDVPRNRIFTINTNSEVSLDLLTLNKMKMSYVNINEVVDHYFPPVSTLVKAEGEEFTDFKYWRDDPLALDDFSASDSDADDDDDDDDDDGAADKGSEYADDEDDEEIGDDLADSYISRDSIDETAGRYQRQSFDDEEEYDEEEGDDDYDDGEGGYDSEDDTQIAQPRIPELKHLKEDKSGEVITGVEDDGAFPKPLYVEEPVEIRPT